MLNLALAGLKRLLENGDYTGAKSIEETRQLYIQSSDSCKAFVEEKLEESESPDDFIATESLYQIYVAYCKKNRLPKVEKKPALDQAVRQNFPSVEHCQERVGERRSWVWRYLKTKTVTLVTLVTAPTYSENSEDSKQYRMPVTTVTTETNDEAEQPQRNDGKLERALGHRPPKVEGEG
jgi:phage/plasmid-associated DNA primase